MIVEAVALPLDVLHDLMEAGVLVHRAGGKMAKRVFYAELG